MSIPASAKYAIIREMTMRDNNRLNISWLCETAGVTRSGYYSYLESEPLRQQREQQDREDFLKILEAYKFRGYRKGARSIYMRLIHLKPPVVMNLKKIRRLMKKYNLPRSRSSTTAAPASLTARSAPSWTPARTAARLPCLPPRLSTTRPSWTVSPSRLSWVERLRSRFLRSDLHTSFQALLLRERGFSRLYPPGFVHIV